MASVYNWLVIKSIRVASVTIWVTYRSWHSLRKGGHWGEGCEQQEIFFSVCKSAFKALCLLPPAHMLTSQKERSVAKNALHWSGLSLLLVTRGSWAQPLLKGLRTKRTKPHTRFVNTPQEHHVPLDVSEHEGRHTGKRSGWEDNAPGCCVWPLGATWALTQQKRGQPAPHAEWPGHLLTLVRARKGCFYMSDLTILENEKEEEKGAKVQLKRGKSQEDKPAFNKEVNIIGK